MRRSFTVSLLLLCAVASEGRVISYAPYTDQGSHRAYQSRTTRHFALAESHVRNVTENYVYNGQVVLYDTAGEENPRVVYPKSGTAHIYAVALFQESNETPVLLVITDKATVVSRDGGHSWRPVTGSMTGRPRPPSDVDYGGPWTRGLSARVRIGTRAWPFVVEYGDGVYAIASSGRSKLMLHGPVELLGQNREGNEFLMRTTRNTLVAINLDGNWRSIGKDITSADAGWLAPDGSAYLIGGVYDRNRFVWVYRNGRLESIFHQWHDATFAVPTHDFNGAWLVAVDDEYETTLYRHRPGGELEMMWIDEDGPQVEALHAGASGETVLIQVHRPRPRQTNFIDPALAVWRVGGPAPSEYDELFAREGPGKGFVHVDVDRIESGKPFVFDSSFIIVPGSCCVSSGGGGDVIQEWGVLRASLKQRLVISGATRKPGLLGTQWLTDVTLYNPLRTRQKVAVQLAGDDPRSATITLEPEEIRVITDALGTLFEIEEDHGALIVEPEDDVNVTARTYWRIGAGTLGYAVHAVDFLNAASPRFGVSFAGAFPSPTTDTRVVVTDTSGHGTSVQLQVCDANGKAGSPNTAAAPANGVLFIEETLDTLGAFSSQQGGLIVQPTRGTGIASVIATDRLTGDATWFPPDIPASTVRTVPFIVHTDAKDGVPALRSDLYVMNLSPVMRSITLEVKMYDTAQWPRVQTYSLKPFEAKVIEDPLMKLFNLKGMARLRYFSNGPAGDTSGVRLTSRTYTVAENGGTYGTLVPPMNSFQNVTGGETLEILTQISGMQLSLGIAELSPNPRGFDARVTIVVVDQAGKAIGTTTATLPSSGGTFIEDLFAKLRIAAPEAARIIVRAHDTSSLIGAYALLTDRETRDTTYVGANLQAKEE